MVALLTNSLSFPLYFPECEASGLPLRCLPRRQAGNKGQCAREEMWSAQQGIRWAKMKTNFLLCPSWVSSHGLTETRVRRLSSS